MLKTVVTIYKVNFKDCTLNPYTGKRVIVVVLVQIIKIKN
jgi:hypothetical protein